MVEVAPAGNMKGTRKRGRGTNKRNANRPRNSGKSIIIQKGAIGTAAPSKRRQRRARSAAKRKEVQPAPVYQKSPVPTFVTDEETNTIRIDNLQRPFSNNSLKELLTNQGGPLEDARTVDVDGKEVVKDSLWLDTIKSHAYATFTTTEDAKKALNALQDMQWPEASLKQLHVQFSSRTAFDRTDDIVKHEEEEEQKAKEFAAKTEKEREEEDDEDVQDFSPVDDSTETTGRLVVRKRSDLDSSIRFEITLDSPTESREGYDKLDDKLYTQPLESKVSVPTAEEQLVRAEERAAQFSKSVGSEALVANPIRGRDGYIDGNHEVPLGLDITFRRTMAAPRLYWQPLPRDVVDERLPSIQESREHDEFEYSKYLDTIGYEDGGSPPRYGNLRSRSRSISRRSRSRSRSWSRSQRRPYSRSRSPRRHYSHSPSPRSHSPSPRNWSHDHDNTPRRQYPDEVPPYRGNYDDRREYPPHDDHPGPLPMPGMPNPGWEAGVPAHGIPPNVDTRSFPPPPLLPQDNAPMPPGPYNPYDRR